MSDAADGLLSKLMGAGGRKTRKALAIHYAVVGVVLLLAHLLDIASAASSVMSNSGNIGGLLPINYVVVGVTVYAGSSLIAIAYLLVQRPFITPEVKAVRCHFCDCVMKTATLVCDNCESKSDKGK